MGTCLHKGLRSSNELLLPERTVDCTHSCIKGTSSAREEMARNTELSMTRHAGPLKWNGLNFLPETHSQARKIFSMDEMCLKDTVGEDAIRENTNIEKDIFLLLFFSLFQRYLLEE